MVWLIPVAVAVVIVAALLVGVHFMPEKWNMKLIRRSAALLLFAVHLVRFMMKTPAVYGMVTLTDPVSPFPENPFFNAVAILLIWFNYAAIFTTLLGEFFEFRTLRNVINFMAVPVFLLSLGFFEPYATGFVGKEGFVLSNYLVWLLIAECVLGLTIALSHAIKDKGITLPKGKEIVDTVLGALGAIISFIPAYSVQALFGHVDGSLDVLDLSEVHRFIFYGSLVVPIILYHLVKDKSPAAKHFIMSYLAIGGLWIFIADRTFMDWIIPGHWPLHLCNFAMFIIAFAVLFKWEKLFYFTMFVNVLGSVLAMLMPDYSATHNLLSNHILYFWINHYMAFFMPILTIALKVFPRPRFKEWLWSQAGFAGYYVIAVAANACFGTDYFFTNSDHIADKLGRWALDICEMTWSIPIGDQIWTFRPLYQVLYFLGYVLMSAGVWFVYELLYKIWDAGEERREKERAYRDMRKRFEEYMSANKGGGAISMSEPVSGDDSPRIVLRDFRKRYGNNNYYSVDGVSFEVNAGEIFGFLGPNGAGKSTIIKSMVGIQTITSGNIEICGFDVEMQSVLAKKNIGFVPDHYALYENLTGREYVNYIADLFEVDRETRDAVIEKYVERFQLTGSFDNPMKTYSHGMKQKITIMSALVHNPKVWILDEPLTGLDPTSIHEVKECMKEHAAAGNIVFFSSHIIDVVEKLCDRIAIIRKGKLQACTTIEALNDAGIELEQFYLDVIYNQGEAAPTEAADPEGEVAPA